MRLRSIVFVTAGAIGAAVGGAAISAAITDPDARVATVAITGVSATPTTVTASSPTGAGAEGNGDGNAGGGNGSANGGGVVVQTVDGLEQLVGTLRAGGDPDDWYVSGVEVDFGPAGWISSAPASQDYDGDGAAEALLDELRGLDGRSVTLGVRFDLDDDRDDAYAFIIEGLAYRDPTGGAAPWQLTPPGVEATRDQIAAAAVAAVGQGSVVIDIDRDLDDGWTSWDVEVRAADGREYEVFLDSSGIVVDVRLYID